MNIMEQSLALHRKLKGKITVENKYDIQNTKDLSLLYTPGVASSCLRIKDHPEEAYELTSKNNTVAVISDGTAVLGLGDIGPLAAMPVMEGKCAIFKRFAGLNAVPFVLNTKDTEELIKTIYHLAPSFGAINLEDISAPRCFEIEQRLRDMLDIPVFHDDQHGTAIVTGAALLNALRLVKKEMKDVKIVINGAGAAGTAITTFLMHLGARHIIVCDKNGILDPDGQSLNDAQAKTATITNPQGLKGTLQHAVKDADVLIGVSVGHVVSQEMVRAMNADAIVFAMANPVPEIQRDDALAAGARIYGAGISNIPNQINNALVFPGLLKGAIESRVRQIDIEMEIAACKALAALVSDDELQEDYIIPNIFNQNVSKAVSEAVMQTSLNT